MHSCSRGSVYFCMQMYFEYKMVQEPIMTMIVSDVFTASW